MNYETFSKLGTREAVTVAILFFAIVLITVIMAPQAFCLVALYFIIVAFEKRNRHRGV